MLIFILSLAGRAESLTLTWDPNPETNIASYVLHWGTNSGHYAASTNCGVATIFSIANAALFPCTNFFAVTAVNISGLESDYSNEIFVVAPISAPKNFKVKLSMDSAPSPIGPWTEAIALTNSFAVQDTAYFRGRLDIQPSSGVP